MSQTNSGYVFSEHHQGVGTIEFHHPKGNSMPAQLLADLAKAIRSASHDPEVRVIILRSGGSKVFCSGASFDELIAVKNAEEGKAFFSGFAHVLNAMRKCHKFILTRVQGHCIGGGVGIAAASDYCFALSSAEVKLSELSIGIGPFVIGPAVERKIGLSAFSQLAIDANSWRTAEWARRRGLFTETHSSTDSLDEAIQKLARSLALTSPEAMAETKRMFWHGTDHWDHLLEERAAISGRLVLTEAAQAALTALKKA